MLKGNGFVHDDDMWVQINWLYCDIKSVTLDTIVCLTAKSSSTANSLVQVRSNGIRYTASPRFRYSNAMTPTITSIEPASGTVLSYE